MRNRRALFLGAGNVSAQTVVVAAATLTRRSGSK